jgi:mRNA interferase MazF
VVVSRTDRPGNDLILAFVSSVVPAHTLPTYLLLFPSHADFGASGLKVPSVVKCDKLATVDRGVILGELGALSASLLQEVDRRLKLALDLL